MIDETGHTPEEQAIADCKYARDCGMTALKQHWLNWRGATVVAGSDDSKYARTVMEIWDKLGTEECLLKEE